MEKLLEEEMCRARKWEEHTKFRDYTVQSLLSLSVTIIIFFPFILYNQGVERNKIKIPIQGGEEQRSLGTDSA